MLPDCEVQPPASPAETRDAPLGLSMGRLAIAETGSVLLSEPTLEDRSVGMLTLATPRSVPLPRSSRPSTTRRQ